MNRISFHPITLSLAATSLSTFVVSADTFQWDGIVALNPGSPWATAANWSTAPAAAIPDPGAAPGASDDAIFNIAGATARTQIYLDADQAAQSLTFDSPGGVDIFANSSDTVARNLTVGSGGVLMNPGSGQVVFSGASATYGTINVQVNASQTWKNNSSGLLSLYGNNATAATLASGAVLTFDGWGPSQVGPNNTTLANITGAGGIAKSGSGTLTLFSNGSYSGGTTLNAGTIAIGNTGALGLGGNLTINGGTIRSASTATYSLAGKLTGINVNSDVILGDTTATGALTFDGPINLGSSSRNLTVHSGVTLNSSATGVINGSSGVGIIKTGNGTLTLGGTTAHTFDGGLTAKAGSFVISLANMTTPTDLLPSGSPISFANSVFAQITGKNSASSSQTLGDLTLGAGVSNLRCQNGTGTSTLGVTLGNTWTRNDLGAFHLQMNSSSGITVASSPALTNGIVGPWATFYLNTSPNIATYYATVVGGNVVPLTSGPNYATVPQSSDLTDTTGTINYDLTAVGFSPDDTTPATGFNGNTVRFNSTASGTTLLGGSFSANGLMNASNANSVLWTIGAGTLTIGSTRELVVNTNTRLAPSGNGMAINATIADNAAGASGLTVAGWNSNVGAHPSPLTLSTANTYSGKTVINGSSGIADGLRTIIISALRDKGANSEFGAATAGSGVDLALNNGFIQTSVTGASDRNITIAGNGGFYVKGAITQTLAGTISGSGNLWTDGDFTTGGPPGGTGNLVLSGDNSFTGDMLFQNDSRVTLGHVNALKNATLVMNGVRILADLTFSNLAYNIGGLRGSVNLNLGSGADGGGTGFVTIGSNNQSNTYIGALSGGAGLVKTGSGTQTLTAIHTYTGDTVVDSGTLKLLTTSTTGVTGGGASGALTINSLTSTAGLAVGQAVSGTGIAPGAKIVSIDSATQVTVSVAHTGVVSGTLTFGGQTTSFASPAIEVKSGAILDVTDTTGYTVDSGKTLKGAGTVTGNLTNAGTLAPGTPTGGIATLTTGRVSFSATGEYACTLDGANCDLLAAGSLTVDPAAKITFTGTPTAASLVIATYSGAEPTHFATDASLPAGYSLDYTSPGQIKLVSGAPIPPYQTWAGSKGLSGGGAAPDANPDNDGLPNAIEFVVGGEPNPANPGADSSALVPTEQTTATDLVFTFRRTALALTQPGIGIVVRYGSNLSDWTEVAIPATTPGSPVNGATITITPNGFEAGVDKVEVSIPKSLAIGAKMFAGLKVSLPTP